MKLTTATRDIDRLAALLPARWFPNRSAYERVALYIEHHKRKKS